MIKKPITKQWYTIKSAFIAGNIHAFEHLFKLREAGGSMEDIFKILDKNQDSIISNLIKGIEFGYGRLKNREAGLND